MSNDQNIETQNTQNAQDAPDSQMTKDQVEKIKVQINKLKNLTYILIVVFVLLFSISMSLISIHNSPYFLSISVIAGILSIALLPIIYKIVNKFVKLQNTLPETRMARKDAIYREQISNQIRTSFELISEELIKQLIAYRKRYIRNYEEGKYNRYNLPYDFDRLVHEYDYYKQLKRTRPYAIGYINESIKDINSYVVHILEGVDYSVYGQYSHYTKEELMEMFKPWIMFSK